MRDIVLNSTENLGGDLLENHIMNELDINIDAKLKQILNFNENQISQKILSIKRGAFREELHNVYRSYFRLQIQEGRFDELIPDLAEVRDFIDNEKDKKKTSEYLWITINPRSSVNIIEFKQILQKSLTKPWIKGYCAVIEQRGCSEDEIGKGFHAHIILNKGDYRFTHARREFQSSYRKVCDIQNFHTFNFSYCFENDLKNRHNYILGHKKDPEKHIKQIFDKKFRNIYNIPSYYGQPLCEYTL